LEIAIHFWSLKHTKVYSRTFSWI